MKNYKQIKEKIFKRTTIKDLELYNKWLKNDCRKLINDRMKEVIKEDWEDKIMDGNENIFAETFGYNTNAFESSVKCIEEQQALNEAMFSISSDGKKIKKSIKEKCKEMRKREGFFGGGKKVFQKHMMNLR